MQHKASEVDSHPQEKTDLSLFLEPQSVAVIGSLREGYFGGYVVVKTLLKAGFKGKLYPVNPSYQDVLGLKVFPSIRDIPEKIDLAYIIINRRTVPNVMKECAEGGIKAVVVVADGFAERDEGGVKPQKEIVEIARQRGMRIIGPNTAGIANPAHGFIPDPYEMGYDKVKVGGIAIELFELPKLFVFQSLPKRNRLCIVTFAGGVEVLAIDEAAKYGLSVAKLSPETVKKLNAIFPDLGKMIVDIGSPMAVINNYMDIYSESFEIVLTDDNTDCLFNVLWKSPFEEFVEEYLRFYEGIKGSLSKNHCNLDLWSERAIHP